MLTGPPSVSNGIVTDNVSSSWGVSSPGSSTNSVSGLPSVVCPFMPSVRIGWRIVSASSNRAVFNSLAPSATASFLAGNDRAAFSVWLGRVSSGESPSAKGSESKLLSRWILRCGNLNPSVIFSSSICLTSSCNCLSNSSNRSVTAIRSTS